MLAFGRCHLSSFKRIGAGPFRGVLDLPAPLIFQRMLRRNNLFSSGNGRLSFLPFGLFPAGFSRRWRWLLVARNTDLRPGETTRPKHRKAKANTSWVAGSPSHPCEKHKHCDVRPSYARVRVASIASECPQAARPHWRFLLPRPLKSQLELRPTNVKLLVLRRRRMHTCWQVPPQFYFSFSNKPWRSVPPREYRTAERGICQHPKNCRGT